MRKLLNIAQAVAVFAVLVFMGVSLLLWVTVLRIWLGDKFPGLMR